MDDTAGTAAPETTLDPMPQGMSEDEILGHVLALEQKLATSEAHATALAQQIADLHALRGEQDALVDALRAQVVQVGEGAAAELAQQIAKTREATIAAVLGSRLYRIEYGAPGKITRLWVLASTPDEAIAKIASEHPNAGLQHARDVDVALRF